MINFALDMRSPSIVRTCHSVRTSRSREAGIDSYVRNRLPRLLKIYLGFFPRRKAHWQWYFFFFIHCTFFKHQILSVSGLKFRKCFPSRIWCPAKAKHKMVLLPTNFLVTLRSNSRPRNDPGFFPFTFVQ